MSLIVNIRGTSGSGKSTAVKQFVELPSTETIYYSVGEHRFTKNNVATICKKPNHDIKGYHVPAASYGSEKDLYVVGPYKTPTGGCDTIATQDAICGLVREFATKGNVVFEGLLVSGLFKRYNALALELPEHKFIFGFLDTPLEKCISQTLGRRAKKGNHKPFDADKTLAPKFHAIIASRAHLTEAGQDCRDIPHRDSFLTVAEWFRGKHAPSISPEDVAKLKAIWDTMDDQDKSDLDAVFPNIG